MSIMLQVVFHIDGGSGRFAVKGSSNTIAKVDYKGKSEILVSPMSFRKRKLASPTLQFIIESN